MADLLAYGQYEAISVACFGNPGMLKHRFQAFFLVFRPPAFAKADGEMVFINVFAVKCLLKTFLQASGLHNKRSINR